MSLNFIKWMAVSSWYRLTLHDDIIIQIDGFLCLRYVDR